MGMQVPFCRYHKWFEPRGISYMFSVIFRVRVVLRKTGD